MGRTIRQLRALLLKTVILKKRRWISTLLEVTLPVFVILLLMYLHSQVDIVTTPASLHLTEAYNATAVNYTMPFLATALYITGGKIAVAPANELVDVQDYLKAANLGDRIIPFESSIDIDNYVARREYGTESSEFIHAAIVRDNEYSFDYSLRFNASTAFSSEMVYQGTPNTKLPTLRTIQKGYEPEEARYYMERGLMELEQMLGYLTLHNTGTVNFNIPDNQSLTPSDVASANILFNFIPFPTPEYIHDDFSSKVGGYLGLLFTLTFIWPITRIVSGIVEEKELRIKEGMKMMGLRDMPLVVSWLVTHLAMFIVTCFLIAMVSMTTLYNYSSVIYIFIYFYAFCVAVYGFSFIMSTFFDRARVASTFSAIIFLALFFVIYSVEGPDITRDAKQLACLSPAVCLSLGAKAISQLESSHVGVTTSTLNTIVDNFSYLDAVFMLFFDGIVMFLAGLYLEQVLPSQYGLRRPWYFLCTRRFWAGSTKVIKASEDESSSLLNGETPITELNEFYTRTETPDVDLAGTELVRVRHLRKEFPLSSDYTDETIGQKLNRVLCCKNTRPVIIPDKDDHNNQLQGLKFVAVKDLSFDMYKDQIFTLLGHNGAGKTTTINMLTGLYAPTEGEARVLDYNIGQGMDAIRCNMGVCPQHDILYPYLTVREHLELYAEIKNINPRTRMIEIDEMIDAVGLGIDGDNKANSLAGSLSGGQMRKLSVGIALLGGSRVVYLDEPSSGMDVASQRHIWDLLMKAKKDRVIVLTTHFMEEAEIGDRIAIMAAGRLQCIGSSLYLKNSYGVGYSLTISKDTQNSKVDSKAIVKFMQEKYQYAELLSNAGGEVSFRLPFSASSEFANMFDALELNKKELGITTYGISVTTLTEVFLKVGHGYISDEEIEELPVVKTVDQHSINSSNGTVVTSHDTNEEELNMYHDIDPKEQQIDSISRLVLHTKALFLKRWHNSKRDLNQWIWQILYPGALLTLSLISQKSQVNPIFPQRDLLPTALPAPNNFPYPNVVSAPNVGFMMSRPLNTTLAGFTPIGATDSEFEFNDSNLVTPYVFSSYLAKNAFELENPRYTAVQFDDLQGLPMFNDNAPTKIHANVYYNTTAADALPISFATVINAMINANHEATGKTGDAPSFNIHNHPLDRTNSELVITASMAATSIALAFSFIPATFASFIVKERQDKGKHLQLISGVSPLAYWLSTLLWDLVNYTAPFIMAMFLLIIFQIKAALGSAFFFTVVNFWAFCLAVAPFVYVLTFLFENHSAAQNMTLMLNFFLSVVLIIICIIMDLMDSTKNFNYYLRYIYRLLPPFAFVEGFVNVFASDAAAIFTEKKSAWSYQVSGWPITYQFANFFIYTIILFAIEHYTTASGSSFFQTFFSMFMKKPVLDEQLDGYSSLEQADVYGSDDTENDPKEDSDVADERLRIQAGMCNDAPVVISGLRKTYPSRMGREPFTAVQNLYYSVARGECFGFLGANGAGKTTTIKMLTGDEKPTKGTARLGGKDIMREPYEVRQLMGYCPQFDALVGLMTAREHLEMYARIKCIPERVIPNFIQRMLVKLGLEKLADRPAGTYSGGNKRKLSVGIALIGNPLIVFLDEPSTGMDPQARRFMWQLISSTMVGRSVILTTHSMEECEALCHRIGIMTKGRLRCLGTSQHLKSKFGQGFKLIVKAHEGSIDTATNFILNNFPGSERFEAHGSNLKFKVPKANLSLADVFRTIEAQKPESGIATYSVSDTDLEQIFVNFVREGESDESISIAISN